MDPIIRTEQLTVIYDQGKPSETIAIQDVNIEIFPEEYIVIFGPSGCGKSTLLYALTGMEKPTHGKVLIKNNDISVLNPTELARFMRRNIGFIFQAYNLIPTLNVIQNVALPQMFEGQMKYTRMDMAKKLLTRFGVEMHADKLPQEMSGGQQQRVGIARSLINDPAIIFADEPVGNLDSRSAENVLQILLELNEKDKKTIILVTHEPRYLTYAHRVFYMRDGHLIKVVSNPQRAPLVHEVPTTPALPRVPTKEEVHAASHFYGNLSEEGAKAKIITDVLGTTHAGAERERIEAIIADRLGEKKETNDCIIMLMRSLEEGGAGIPEKDARDIMRKVNAMIEKLDFLKDSMREEQGQTKKAGIETLRHRLLEDYKTPLSFPQLHHLDALIESYTKGSIDQLQFANLLANNVQKGGVELPPKIAAGLALKLESLHHALS